MEIINFNVIDSAVEQEEVGPGTPACWGATGVVCTIGGAALL